MSVENERRIARYGDQVIRGVGLISDSNGPFTLAFRIDGISQMVVLNTMLWKVEWEEA